MSTYSPEEHRLALLEPVSDRQGSIPDRPDETAPTCLSAFSSGTSCGSVEAGEVRRAWLISQVLWLEHIDEIQEEFRRTLRRSDNKPEYRRLPGHHSLAAREPG